MERHKSLVSNVIWNAILSLSQILFPLITFPYITRVLGVEANGANSFALSVVNYFALFASLGMSTYGVKACAQVKDNKDELSKVVQELLAISGTTTFIVIVILYMSIYFVPSFRSYSAIMFVYSFNIILNVIGVNWLFQGIEKFNYITIVTMVFKLISIVLMFVFVRKPEDLVKYAIITVFASYGSNLINFFYAKKFISFRKTSRYNLLVHLKPIMYLFATALAVNIYSHMDSVMLGLICGDYDTGIYYVAVKVKTILITLVSSFSVVIMSRLSYVKTQGNETIIKLLEKSYSVIVMITVPLMIFFILYAKESILFLSGQEYLDSIRPMQLLMPTIFVSAVSQILGNQYSVSVGKEKNLMLAVICGAVVNLLVNALLIPKYSYNGAAIGTICAEITQCLIQMIMAKRVVQKVFSIKKLWMVTCASIVAIIVAILVKNQIVFGNVFVSLCVNAISFFVIYFAVLLIEKYDILYEIVRSILKK